MSRGEGTWTGGLAAWLTALVLAPGPALAQGLEAASAADSPRSPPQAAQAESAAPATPEAVEPESPEDSPAVGASTPTAPTASGEAQETRQGTPPKLAAPDVDQARSDSASAAALGSGPAGAPGTPAVERPGVAALGEPGSLDSDPALDELSDPGGVRALTRAEVLLRQRQLLQARLSEADRELAETSTLLPTALVVLGLATAAVGVAIGVRRAVGCQSGRVCDGANSAAGTLSVGGLGVSAAGLLWWYIERDDERVLRSKRYQIANQLQWLVAE